MAEWPFLLADTGGAILAELPARSRRVSWRLDDNADAGFTVSGTAPEVAGVVEMETDLVVYRDDRCLFRGRFGPSADDIGDAHECQLNAVDYRGFLTTCRMIHPDATLAFTDAEAADVGWTLVDDAQDDTIQVGSALGITRGVDVGSSVVIDQTYEPGVFVGDAVEKLGRLNGGFEWEVAPDPSDPAILEFNSWAPQRGTLRDFVASMDDGTVTRWSRSVDTSKYGTLVRHSGADGVDAYTAPSADIASKGRVDRVYGDTSLSDAATVQAAAEGQLALAERLLPAYTGTLTIGVWSPDVLWLGDTCRVVVQSGRLDDDLYARVVAIDVDVPDDGGEIVRVTWGRPAPDLFRPQRDLQARVTSLERR